MNLLGITPSFAPLILARELTWREQQLQSMHEHFVESDPLIYVQLIIGLAAVLAIYLAIRLLSYVQHRRIDAAKPQPFALFMRVQAQLGLPLRDRWQLWRMARTLRLADPTAMLISPAFFDRTVERYAPGRTGHANLMAIRDRLFGKSAV